MRCKAAAPFALLIALAPAALPAQSSADRQRGQVRQVIVYGDDPCPRGTGDEVIVCARRPEGERFRVPETLRTPADPRAPSNLQRDRQHREAAATGPQSCSAVGPGGASGCLLRDINNSRVGLDGDEDEAAGGSGPN
jgi:hypothetical protein